jgi:transcriptional regulator GlxA family with amidase domain
MTVHRTALLLFDGCDLLDVGGPYEVLLTASRLAVRRGDQPPFEVLTVSVDGTPVTAYGGLGLVPSHAVDDLHELDAVIVPGAIDVEAALSTPGLVPAVRRLSDLATTATSVCTGAFLLAAAGRLRDHAATTHHEDLPDLRAREDVGRVVEGVRWVDDGPVITAAGLSSGIAFGLHLVDRVAGRELALATARQIEHPFDPDGAVETHA